jgi:predicted metal-binding membrane protein
MRRVQRGPAPGMVFPGAAALLFAAGVALTVKGHGAMPALPGLPMCRGGSAAAMPPMSMWLPVPGQSWAGTFAAFMAMWAPMMVAMMLPALLPVLWRYRARLDGGVRADAQAAGAGLAYFLVWMLAGVMIFAGGATLALAAARYPPLAASLPRLSAIAVLLAGLWQLSAWKAHRLACCRAVPGGAHPGAWHHGFHLGLHCNASCASHTAALLALGLMDLRVMIAVTIAITLERLAPRPEPVVRCVGVVLVLAGLTMIARAI